MDATPGGRALLGDMPVGVYPLGATHSVPNGPTSVLGEAWMPPALVDPELVKGRGLCVCDIYGTARDFGHMIGSSGESSRMYDLM